MSNRVEFFLSLKDSLSREAQVAERNFTRSMTGMESSARTLNSSLGFLKTALIGIGGVAVIKNIFNIKTLFDDLRVSLNTMLGETRGAKMFDELADLADRTKFFKDQVIRQGQALIGYGVEADNVVGIIRRLSDVSQGNFEVFRSLTDAFGQVKARGRLTGQELQRFRTASFMPLNEISKATGISVDKLSEIMQKGGISFKTFAKTLKIATSAGGTFDNMSEKIAVTLGGRWSTAVGVSRSAMAKLGNALEPAMMGFTEFLISGLEAFMRNTAAVDRFGESVSNVFLSGLEKIKTFSKFLVANRSVIVSVIPAVLTLTKGVLALKAAQVAYNIAVKAGMLLNPYTAAIVGVTFLVGKLVESVDWSERLQSIFNEFDAGNFKGVFEEIGNTIHMVFAKLMNSVAKMLLKLAPKSIFMSSVKDGIDEIDKSWDEWQKSKKTKNKAAKASKNKDSPTSSETFVPDFSELLNATSEVEETIPSNSIRGGVIKTFNINIDKVVGIESASLKNSLDIDSIPRIITRELSKELSQISMS